MLNRIANGDAIPSSVTGMMNKIITETKEPAITPRRKLSKALAARRRIGREMRGTRAVVKAAQAKMLKKVYK